MIKIVEVTNRKLQKEFVNFPIQLYKGNKNFVPPLYSDELSIFKSTNVYYNTCDSIYYNAYKDGKMVGRIHGIIQKQHNEITNEKRVRFTRFDSIDDVDVAKALFNAVETWAKEQGMDIACGPLGFSDLEREGLLIEGFDQLSTFEEQYNYEYYAKLIEACGYQKEVDWVEYKIYPPKEKNDRIDRIVDVVLRRNKLKIVRPTKSKKAFINKYKDGIFHCLDECYKELYGVVPFTNEMKKQMIDQFNLIISKRLLEIIVDENDRVVGFGIVLPSIARAVQKSNGHLTIPAICRILKATRSMKVLDLALVGVLPEYQKKGVNAVFLKNMMTCFEKYGTEYFETNLNLENNENVQAQWEHFTAINHKRRRSYIKKIS